MSTESNDLQKYLVLFVDDEDKTRKYFKRLFGDTFRIVVASDGVEALQVLKNNLDEVGVVITDQRMPNETGVAFLEKAVKLKPSIVRILSTAYADIEAAIDSVNKGGVYRYITKPWDVADLEITLRRAMEFFMLQGERDELLRQKITGIETLALVDRVLSLAALAAAREQGLRHVGDGLQVLAQLHGVAIAHRSPDRFFSRPKLGWNELYRRHHAFLAKAVSLLPQGLSGAVGLNASESVSAASAIQSAVGDDAQFGIGAAGAVATRLPGPEAQVTGLLKAIVTAVKATLTSEDRARVMDQGSGVELIFPAAGIGPVLDPLFDDALATPDEKAFQLVAAVLRFTHAGGTLDVLPVAGTGEVRLRLNFSADRIAAPAQDALESVAGDLIGNELFWNRQNS